MTFNDDDNPWGKKRESDSSRKKEKESDQVDDFVDQIKEKFYKGKTPFDDVALFKKRGGGGSSGGPSLPDMPSINKGGVFLFALGAAALWLSSGIYMVQEGDVSVVLRFGKQVRSVSAAGLAYRLPWPIESNIVRRTEAVNQIDGASKSDKDEKTLVLTGDENMIHVNYSVFWKIKDLSSFLFTNRTPEDTIKAAAESSIREVLGQTTARLALTSERENIGPQARDVLQKILDHYEMGVEITNFQLLMVEPPSEVIEAFNDMQASLIDANRLENDAQSYANSVIPNARGQAVSLVQEAKAYAETALGKAKGEAAQFVAIHDAVKENKKITLQRLYLEGMQRILSAVKNKTLIDGSVGNGVLPYVSLDKRNKKTDEKD